MPIYSYQPTTASAVTQLDETAIGEISRDQLERLEQICANHRQFFEDAERLYDKACDQCRHLGLEVDLDTSRVIEADIAVYSEAETDGKPRFAFEAEFIDGDWQCRQTHNFWASAA